MRTRWPVIAGCIVGFLLLAAALAIPYVDHLVHPDSLTQSALRRPTRYAVSQTLTTEAVTEAVIPRDRQIDDVGAHIQTEADARAYVEALVRRWAPNEESTEFEERLARAEYAATRGPDKLIPESRVAKTFNHLMDEWDMPWWTRVSTAELHEFRTAYATATYPRSVARLPDRSIAPGCRPTEALFLLDMLNFNGGIPPEFRDQVRYGHFPWSLLGFWRMSSSRPERVEPGLHPAPPSPRLRQQSKYVFCRAKHFASHQFNFDAAVNEIFAQLGIP